MAGAGLASPIITVDPAGLPGAERVLVMDLGAQYTLLIARRIRELGVYCEVVPGDLPAAEVLARRPKALVLSGGPASVYQPGAPRIDPALWESGLPILGICYGMQLMAQALGGEVRRGERQEFGRSELEVAGQPGAPGPGRLFQGVAEPGQRLVCWMSHGDVVTRPPPGFRTVGRTAVSPVAAMEHETRPLFGVQFHPEVAHTPFGMALLRHFLLDLAGAAGGWDVRGFGRRAVEALRERLPEGRAVVAVSGGVDSATAAAVVHRAIGDRLVGIFVDHGLMRRGEPEFVRRELGERLGIPLVTLEAGPRFLQALRGVRDPEEKRRIVGREFIRLFEEAASGLEDVRYLVQGTLYPDVVESGGGRTATIKSHHNVGGLPERLGLTLVEPLRFLFKDEVRALARELGLPARIVERHPFPGPGLAVRIVGEVTPEALETVRACDAIVMEEVERAGLDREVWQAFAVWTGSYSVGVKGDARLYGPVVAVRCVQSQDGMTADWVRLPYEVLDRISHRITNEVPHVSRVVYDISPKPPATIEWE
ncbi:MAG TPA: glutamine-hydrolyzing GMP synthase [Limnochordales bacterium]